MNKISFLVTCGKQPLGKKFGNIYEDRGSLQRFSR